MDILQRLRDLMVERGWSEYRLTKEAGISQSTISNVFKRNTAPTLPTLEALCHAFGITMAQLFSEDGDPVVLTNRQRRILAQWSTLTEVQQESLLDLIRKVSRK